MTDLDLLGGKGANLLRLREAGFDVPDFVVLGTDEYRAFVAAHDLDAVIAAALTRPAAEASEEIRAAFRRPLPADQRARLVRAVAPLLDRPVAVRSSATAEDLPEASFAGQQDTFLDVRGLDAVLDAVVECWSSLWTERAIAYRARNAVDHAAVALAVVVQEMVAAEASGVLFTADPLTGHRGHTVIDAVRGLGEQLVSGRVTPDHFLLDTASGAVLERTLAGDSSSLTDAHLAALVDLGRRAAERFGGPQDLEWVRVGDALHVVQTRPITSLYPLPDPGVPGDLIWLSFGAVQGMLDPITPLGLDVLRRALARAGDLFGRHLDHRTNAFVWPAGERLWIRLDRVIASEAGARLYRRLLPFVEPGTASLVARLTADPAFAPERGAGRTLLRNALPVAVWVLPRAPRTVADPAAARARLDRTVEDLLARLGERLAAADGIPRPELRLSARLRALDGLVHTVFPTLLPAFGRVFPPAMALLARLRVLAARTGLPDADQLTLAVLRGVPGNVTTEMDLALWRVAEEIRADAAAAATFTGADPDDLVRRHRDGTLPPVARDALAGFLERYGMRGVAEIDLGTPRWREQPEGVLRTLASYVAIDDPDRSPDAVYRRGVAEAEAAIETLAAASGRRAGQVRFVAHRLRGLIGARETPKFTIIRAFGLLRTALLASGRDLVAAGVLDAADDVFFLDVDELTGAFGRHDLRDRVAARRAVRARELRRARVPLLMVSDGRTFFEGVSDAAGADLAGAGVSPGVVEGVVRVVHDPRTSELRPGEIMVCRGTDPAWTPLFLTASGLVTEVGGMMTHGSVVAREYGIPAVVGVGGATQVLTDGQRVRLDGTAGTITFLDA
nr:phosphoenolpyruvate synthase [Propionibacterium sp.]